VHYIYLQFPGWPTKSYFMIWRRAISLADYLQKSHFCEGRKEEAQDVNLVLEDLLNVQRLLC
jgi:hypothetical protein